MSLTVSSRGSAFWTWWACFLAIGLAFLGFGWSLDRYPEPYSDETFYNYPAVRFLDGHGFHWQTRPDLPHGDRIWAMHAPFYPRMQIVTLKLMGVNHLAYRLPSYLAAHLAVLSLTTFLLRRSFWPVALAICLLWFGCRSWFEVTLGRMDGLALLGQALGLIAVIRAAKTQTRLWAGAAGCALGFAVGFHPFTLPAFAAGAALVWWLTDPAKRTTQIGMFALGALLPVMLMASFYLPRPWEAWEQFRFMSDAQLSIQGRKTRSEMIMSGWHRFHWARWWLVGLTVSCIGIGANALAWFVRHRFRAAPSYTIRLVMIGAAAFAIGEAALLLWTGMFMYTYYVVFFELWAVVALVAWAHECETHRSGFGLHRIVVAILVFAWLGSFAWNGMRFRETIINYRKWDPKLFVEKLRAHVPRDVPVTGSEEVFPFARAAGLRFEPAPYHVIPYTPPPDTWVITMPVEQIRKRIAAAALAARPLVFDGEAYPDVKYPAARLRFQIYGAVSRPE